MMRHGKKAKERQSMPPSHTTRGRSGKSVPSSSTEPRGKTPTMKARLVAFSASGVETPRASSTMAAMPCQADG